MKRLTLKNVLPIAIVSALLILFYMMNFQHEPPILRAMNSISLIGILNLAAGFWCLLRNSGQFRLFGYMRYSKSRYKQQRDIEKGAIPADTPKESFDEYSDKKYERKWNPWPFFVIGLPLALAFAVLAFYYYNFYLDLDVIRSQTQY